MVLQFQKLRSCFVASAGELTWPKPRVVFAAALAVSEEVEVPPAEARWCPAPAPAPAPGLARDALVNFLGKTLNYPGSEKRSVAINDC